MKIYSHNKGIQSIEYDLNDNETNFTNSKNKNSKASHKDKYRDKELLELEQDRKFKQRLDEIDSSITSLKYKHYDELDENQKEMKLKALLADAMQESK